MPGALSQVCRFFGIKQAGVDKPAGVQPMAISDKKRFAELDALIRAGYGDMKQDDIPDEVMIAAEDGLEIKERGPARDTRFARSMEMVEFVKRVRKPDKKKRVITAEQRERINARARARWFYKYGPRDRPVKRQEGTNADFEHNGSDSRNTYSTG